MNNTLLAFILTFIAGFSTLIGAVFIFYKGDIKKLVVRCLSFAAGVMFSISILDLMPEAFELIYKENSRNNTFLIMLLCILFGFLVSSFIDKAVPEVPFVKDKKLYKVGLFSMFAIIIHNIPEGIATFLSSASNLSLGLSLTFAIALHNIPEGISIAVPIYSASKSKKKALFYTLISALAEPFGALIAYLFLASFITNNIMGCTLAIILGIMTHISMCKLLPASLSYKNKKITWLYFIIGFIFMIVSLSI